MTKKTPKGATSLGHYFYLFKSTTNSKDCLISAHGGYVSGNRTFTVPSGVTIVFYGEHGAALLDPGVYDFAKKMGAAKPKEIFRSGEKCRNYLLTKYQGAHAGSDGKTVVETYDQVARTVSSRDYQRTEKFKNLLAANKDSQAAVLAELMKDWGGSILTVRNRWNVFLGAPLSDAITAVKKEMPSVQVFHAIFCRSYMLGEDPKQAQGVTYS